MSEWQGSKAANSHMNPPFCSACKDRFFPIFFGNFADKSSKPFAVVGQQGLMGVFTLPAPVLPLHDFKLSSAS